MKLKFKKRQLLIKKMKRSIEKPLSNKAVKIFFELLQKPFFSENIGGIYSKRM